jgi:hypothetical protein
MSRAWQERAVRAGRVTSRRRNARCKASGTQNVQADPSINGG